MCPLGHILVCATMLIALKWFCIPHAMSDDCIDYISIYVISYHIAKSVSNSPLKCVFPVASKYFVVKRIIILARREKLVQGKSFFIAFLLKITFSSFELLNENYSTKEMMVSSSMSLLAVGIASGIFLYINLRSR